MTPANSPPVIWTLAGSDSGGGAGIQVDLKVINAFGSHGCSVTTALTAQNTVGVYATQAVSSTMIQSQLEALKNDLPPAAIKTGMLGRADTCSLIADFLAHNTSRIPPGTDAPSAPPPLICDPVLKSTSGTDLLDPEALDILMSRIFPYVTVLTPNLPETERLIGPFRSLEEAAEKLLATGVRSVLIKGGHACGSQCADFWSDGSTSLRLSSPRIESASTHGTGCILASATASALALGQDVPQAIITAKTFLNQCLRLPTGLGSGCGPMRILPFENAEQDRPTVQ